MGFICGCNVTMLGGGEIQFEEGMPPIHLSNFWEKKPSEMNGKIDNSPL